MDHLFTSESLVSLLVLILLELILGVDNVIFVSLIMNRMNPLHRKTAKIFWLAEGTAVRIFLLMGLSWLLQQRGKDVITLPFIDKGLDLASLVQIVGGLFLMWKSIKEIHEKLESDSHDKNSKKVELGLTAGLVQIAIIDMVFSFDSVITAGGTAKHLEIMVAAVVIAMITMFYFSSAISSFIEQHPTLQILALSFLVLIGLSLVIEGWDPEKAEDIHLKNYIYFAMAFAFGVEMLNMQFRKKGDPVELKGPRDVSFDSLEEENEAN